MRIDVWFDFVCPYCFIGIKTLEKVTSGQDDIEIIYHSFELDPNKSNMTQNICELFVNTGKMSREQFAASCYYLQERAKSLGFQFDFDRMIPTETLTAHRVSHYATKVLGNNTFIKKAMESYFTAGGILSDTKTLVKIAKDSGLDTNEVKEIINSDKYGHKVTTDERVAKKYGLGGVPFFVFNEKYTLSGAQSEKVMREAMIKATSAAAHRTD